MQDWITFIPLSHNKRAIIDTCDLERVSKYKWWVHSDGYAYTCWMTSGRKHTLLMHRLIMDAAKGQVVDHINRNRLDNARSNLRFCTRAENCANAPLWKNNTSGYKGVSRYKDGRWRAYIKIGQRFKHIGAFETKEGAAHAYNEVAKEIYGEFAYLNPI